jgi:lambda family phage portal protein
MAKGLAKIRGAKTTSGSSRSSGSGVQAKRGPSPRPSPSKREGAKRTRATPQAAAFRGARRGFPQRLLARYDAARTDDDNHRAWLGADGLAANAAQQPGVRAILRQRGRHEAANNPTMDGMLQTHAGDVVGRGARLQMTTGVEKVDAYIEREFSNWCDRIGLGEKKRICWEAVSAAGEVFGVLFSNPRLPTAVKLDMRLYEGDQVATPTLSPLFDPNRVDGIELDAYGNPIAYHVLKQHPGDTRFLDTATPFDFERLPADRVIHLFKPRRPGQNRGIPRITSSLSLCNQRRGFRQSVLTAARIAAEMGAVLLTTTTMPEGGEAQLADDFDVQEINRGQMTALPPTYDAKQMEAKQPNSSFKEFDDQLVTEGARPLNMPKNIAKCDSSQYNYSSGRLDHQTYDRSNDIDRGDLELKLMDRLLAAWIAEALLIPGYLPYRARFLLSAEPDGSGGGPHAWLWRGRPHVDPVKEAQADEIDLQLGRKTLTQVLADDGIDFDTHLAQLDREVRAYAARGLIHPSQRQNNPVKAIGQSDQPADTTSDAPASNGSANGTGSHSNGHALNRIGGRFAVLGEDE